MKDNIKFDYGKKGLNITLDPKWETTILISKVQEALVDPVKDIRQVIRQPLESESLYKIIKNKDDIEKVCIVVSDATRPVPSHIILEKIEKRLRNTWIRLVCMRIGCEFEKTRRIETLEEIIECPECHSRFIAIVHPNNTKIKKLLNRSVSKHPQHKLDRKEKKDLNTAKKTADLVLSFGKRDAFVLAGRGIGPRTAVRILREPHKDTEDLLASIYKHEAEFARNREYWE